MTRPYCSHIPAATDLRDSIAAQVPRLQTERLILRAPRAEDFPALEAIWLSDRGCYMGGPFSEEGAWLDFTQCAAGWALRGLGYWTVVHRDTQSVLGLVGFCVQVSDPELELGWLITKDAEGQGVAIEAAGAALDYAFRQVGLGSVVSFVDKANARSIAVAKRLGAQEDPLAVPVEYRAQDTAFRHTAEVGQ